MPEPSVPPIAAPWEGVPDKTPEPVPPLNVTPAGGVPPDIETVGLGKPVAVTVCVVPAVKTVKVLLLALVMAGAMGALAGVTLLDALDAAPCPTPLVARTVNVYGVPLVRPVMV